MHEDLDMPLSRTLTIKLIVPRQAGQLSAAQHLWSTHAAVSAAVEYYTSRLSAFYQPLGHQPQSCEAYRQIPENATRK